ncbi:ABC transporter permease [Aeromicrobium sp. UC242_57]|uniref:ABC transporter permease n=1 Tax=Aeromicrobium sp. UC242_57 TaxID=3374624 RepID=UPI0037BC2F91
MRTVILASMRTYARRYVAALVAIVIATAFIVAINALSQAARDGSNRAVEQQYRNADLAVSAVGSVGELDSTARQIKTARGVTDVATNWQAYAAVRFPDGTQNISIGSIATAPTLRWQKVATGRLPARDGEVAVAAAQAAEHSVRAGDTITLDLPAGATRLVVTGTVEDVDGPLKATAYLPERTFSSQGDLGFPLDLVASSQ